MHPPAELRIDPVPYRVIRASTAGLDRVSVRRGDTNVSYFRKRLRKPPPAEPVPDLPRLHADADAVTHWSWWDREIDVYASGLLGDLGPELRAPACHAIERGDGEATLWLQDLAGVPAREWPVARFARLTFALGRFQGRYLAGEPLPSWPWLGRDTVRAQLTRAPQEAHDEDFIAALEHAPQTLCHFDLWSANLFAGATRGCDDATYVIDWSALGIGPPGYDVALAVFDSVWMCEVDSALLPELAKDGIDAYVAGLEAAGFRGDLRAVVRSHATVAELMFARLRPRLERLEADTSKHDTIASMYGLPAPEVFARRHATIACASRVFRDVLGPR